jgi:hypothetical protein
MAIPRTQHASPANPRRRSGVTDPARVRVRRATLLGGRLAGTLLLSLLAAIGVAAQTSTSTPRPAGISVDDAMNLVFNLPEAKAWAAHIERASHGRSRAAVTVYGAAPQTINGRQYWPVEFFEDHPERYYRWQTFLVRIDGKEILVEDVSGEALSLKTWRQRDKPMERAR